MKKFPVLETKRLLLREITLSDTEDIFEYFKSEEVTKYMGIYPLITTFETRELIRDLNELFLNENGIMWAIELRESGKVIGTCGFHNYNKKHKRVELSYEINSNYWNKGYASEALKSIIEYGLKEMDLVRIEALIYPSHIVSEKLLKKLNFEYEGLLKKYFYYRDKHQDLSIFSLINEEN